jgi:hypothetical protein
MIPAPVSLEPFALPLPAPIIPLEVGITPSARGQQLVILPGSSIGGSSVVYSDLHGLSAYAGAGGFDTRGARRGKINRYTRGNEDNNWRKS